MLTLGAFKYSHILAKDGGPVAELTGGPCLIRGRPCYQANARLRPELRRPHTLAVYSQADGSGTHQSPMVARHIAISEALERWAFHANVEGPNRALHGFDLDPTSTGMAAFPGVVPRQARKRAYLEAIERHCLRGWWEGLIPGAMIDTDWPGVKAVVIHGPNGGITAVTFSATPEGRYAYGHAADESLTGAIERAIVEMARHEGVIRRWHATGGDASKITHPWERRALYFSTKPGFERFLHRLQTPCAGKGPDLDVVTDGEICGPWSRFASVWRITVRPPSDRFITQGEDYFFW